MKGSTDLVPENEVELSQNKPLNEKAVVPFKLKSAEDKRKTNSNAAARRVNTKRQRLAQLERMKKDPKIMKGVKKFEKMINRFAEFYSQTCSELACAWYSAVPDSSKRTVFTKIMNPIAGTAKSTMKVFANSDHIRNVFYHVQLAWRGRTTDTKPPNTSIFLTYLEKNPKEAGNFIDPWCGPVAWPSYNRKLDKIETTVKKYARRCSPVWKIIYPFMREVLASFQIRSPTLSRYFDYSLKKAPTGRKKKLLAFKKMKAQKKALAKEKNMARKGRKKRTNRNKARYESHEIFKKINTTIVKFGHPVAESDPSSHLMKSSVNIPIVNLNDPESDDEEIVELTKQLEEIPEEVELDDFADFPEDVVDNSSMSDEDREKVKKRWKKTNEARNKMMEFRREELNRQLENTRKRIQAEVPDIYDRSLFEKFTNLTSRMKTYAYQLFSKCKNIKKMPSHAFVLLSEKVVNKVWNGVADTFKDSPMIKAFSALLRIVYNALKEIVNACGRWLLPICVMTLVYYLMETFPKICCCLSLIGILSLFVNVPQYLKKAGFSLFRFAKLVPRDRRSEELEKELEKTADEDEYASEETKDPHYQMDTEYAVKAMLDNLFSFIPDFRVFLGNSEDKKFFDKLRVRRERHFGVKLFWEQMQVVYDKFIQACEWILERSKNPLVERATAIVEESKYWTDQGNKQKFDYMEVGQAEMFIEFKKKFTDVFIDFIRNPSLVKHPMYHILQNVSRDLRPLELIAHRITRKDVPRPQPLWIHISGQPGCGKTTIVKGFCAFANRRVYTMKQSDPYDDGYSNEEIIVIDDIYSANSATVNMPLSTKLIDIINTSSTPLHIADMTAKGLKIWHAQFMFSTSNVNTIPVTHGLNDINALKRRRTVFASMTKAPDGTKTFKIMNTFTEKVIANLDYQEFVNYVKDLMSNASFLLPDLESYAQANGLDLLDIANQELFFDQNSQLSEKHKRIFELANAGFHKQAKVEEGNSHECNIFGDCEKNVVSGWDDYCIYRSLMINLGVLVVGGALALKLASMIVNYFSGGSEHSGDPRTIKVKVTKLKRSDVIKAESQETALSSIYRKTSKQVVGLGFLSEGEFLCACYVTFISQEIAMVNLHSWMKLQTELKTRGLPGPAFCFKSAVGLPEAVQIENEYIEEGKRSIPYDFLTIRIVHKNFKAHSRHFKDLRKYMVKYPSQVESFADAQATRVWITSFDSEPICQVAPIKRHQELTLKDGNDENYTYTQMWMFKARGGLGHCGSPYIANMLINKQITAKIVGIHTAGSPFVSWFTPICLQDVLFDEETITESDFGIPITETEFPVIGPSESKITNSIAEYNMTPTTGVANLRPENIFRLGRDVDPPPPEPFPRHVRRFERVMFTWFPSSFDLSLKAFRKLFLLLFLAVVSLRATYLLLSLIIPPGIPLIRCSVLIWSIHSAHWILRIIWRLLYMATLVLLKVSNSRRLADFLTAKLHSIRKTFWVISFIHMTTYTLISLYVQTPSSVQLIKTLYQNF